MSQSAENQSAIIENENNSNIAMESQAAVMNTAENINMENVPAVETSPTAEAGPDTPTQDEIEESMSIEEGDSEKLATTEGDVNQEAVMMESNVGDMAEPGSSGDAPFEAQGSLEPPSASLAQAEDHEEAEGDMEVEEAEQDGSIKEAENAATHDEDTLAEAQQEDNDAVLPTEEENNLKETVSAQEDKDLENSNEFDLNGGSGLQEADPARAEETEMDMEEIGQDRQSEEEPEGESCAAEGTHQGEDFVSTEEEDRLLAEENTQSQASTHDDQADVPQAQDTAVTDSLEDNDTVNKPDDLEDDSTQFDEAEVEMDQPLEAESETQDVQESTESQPSPYEEQEEATEEQPEDASEALDDAPAAVCDASDMEKDAPAEVEEEKDAAEETCEMFDEGSEVQQAKEDVTEEEMGEMEEEKDVEEETCEIFDEGSEIEKQASEAKEEVAEEEMDEVGEEKDIAEETCEILDEGSEGEKHVTDVGNDVNEEDRSEREEEKEVPEESGEAIDYTSEVEQNTPQGDNSVAAENEGATGAAESSEHGMSGEAEVIAGDASDTVQASQEEDGVLGTADANEDEPASQSQDQSESGSATEAQQEPVETDDVGDDIEEPVKESTAEIKDVAQDSGNTTALDKGDTKSKPADGSLDSTPAMDAEADKASDATIEEGRDADVDQMLQVADVKSGAEGEGKLSDNQGSVEGPMETDTTKEPEKSGDSESTVKETSEGQTAGTPQVDIPGTKTAPDDDDVVVLDDDEEEEAASAVKNESMEVLNSSNDMGIQIASVSGGADEVHGAAEPSPLKQENEQKPSTTALPPKTETRSGSSTVKKTSKTQTCIVCQKVGKCKYNIVRNGDIKHLCDDACFKRFRANPTLFLKGAGSAPSAEKKSKAAVKPAGVTPVTQAPAQAPVYKTCVVCLLMNINTQGQFCMWKGLDFCGEGCLGKFQNGISSNCTMCKVFIPVGSRPSNCLRLGNEVRPFCGSRCHADFKLHLRLCAMCQKDLATAPDSFSAPVGSEGTFKEFCTKQCLQKFEEVLQADVEIMSMEGGKLRRTNKCSVCQKSEITKHSIKYGGNVHNLCSDSCLSAFQYANKLEIKPCDFCHSLCNSLESSRHMVQYEGQPKRFCSDGCLSKFRVNHRKVMPCSWCGTQRENFEMIERLDSSSKFQLFCSLNCLSLYRVNLQAKSNQDVTCDQCSKFQPAQYHLTMSDASVRNFCSYNCVMSFQAQFSKTSPQPPNTPTQPTPKHKHNTRGKAGRGRPPASAGSPSFPIISNVISLAPQGGQKLNIRNSSGAPVVVSGPGASMQTSSATSQPLQQQIIIQPPPPKPVKNKSILCKPFVQTKATSCRPHTQTRHCQTDEVKEKQILVPVPVPVYLPTPMALYSAPAPTPIFVPIPIPVPIFIPTTRKSASGILKQIKEIREKTPSDPLEAELLMMAAAVSGEGKNSSDSESEEDIMPEISRPRKRLLPADDDDDDANVEPLTSNKEEVAGEEDMISMALRMAEEMSGPITDLESAVEAVPVNTDPPPQPPRSLTPDAIPHEEEIIRSRRGGKRGGSTRRGGGGGGGGAGGAGRPVKRPRMQMPQPEPVPIRQEPAAPPPPPADANYHLKFTYGVNAWRHWVLFKNNQIERNAKPGSGRIKLFKTDIMQCTADELNFSLCLFVKEVRKPNGDEYSPDSIYYLTLGIQQYLFENGRIDNIFTDLYYERFTECLTEILSKCQPKFNASGQMVCRIEEEHLWECKQLGAHSPYVLLNTLIYFHTKYFILKTPDDHMKLSFAHILKYWKKGQQQGKAGQPARSVSLRYYSVSTAKKDGSAPTSTTKKGSKDGIPVYEVTENQDNPLRCPVKLYEFYLSKCPESIKNRSDIFYPVPERSCVPDSPVWYSTMPISIQVMTKMLTRILLVREIQEAHLHAQPIYV